jgi:hypothetical protein
MKKGPELPIRAKGDPRGADRDGTVGGAGLPAP